MNFDYERATQLLNYFAHKEGGTIKQMKALKLIWIAERLHLRRYGTLFVDGEYYAMKLGPVPSETKDLAYLDSLKDKHRERVSTEAQKYLKEYLSPNTSQNIITSIAKPDLEVFSQNEVKMLDEIYRSFGRFGEFDLADFTHLYPEWRSRKDAVQKKKREGMDYLEFFDNLDTSSFSKKDWAVFKKIAGKKDFFQESKERLESAREHYEERLIYKV